MGEVLAVWAGVAITSLMFVMHLVVNLRNGQWNMPDRLKAMEDRIMAAVTSHRTTVDVSVAKLREELERVSKENGEEIERRCETLRDEFGETVRAMQTKISDFEKWSRDHFVRNDEFERVADELRETMRDNRTDASKRFDGLDGKIDTLTLHLLKGAS